MSIAQPDVTLHLDLDGVIRSAELSETFVGEEVEGWVGRPWVETVADVGGGKVRRMLDDAREQGVSAFSQVSQRFSSGLELPMEFTTVMLGGKAGLVAVGKNVLAVAELQSRLISAQQAMERDYWKLREVETRYRLLFDASNEAVLLLRAADLQVVEANPAAIRALGLSPVGRSFLPELTPRDREAFQAALTRVREQGKAPGIMVHLGSQQAPWLIRASLVTAEPGALLLLQLSAVGAAASTGQGQNDPLVIEDLLARIPDGFVVVDREGVILRANRAFLDLVEVGSETSVTGERLGRWLSRPGADLTVLLANVQRHGVVRLFSTAIQGTLGTETEVELSAAGDADLTPDHFGILLRTVGQRLPHPPLSHQSPSFTGVDSPQIGKAPLRKLVQTAIGAVERDYIEATLSLTGGNRTAAAELLGLSRQSLYAKINRYRLSGGGKRRVDPGAKHLA